MSSFKKGKSGNPAQTFKPGVSGNPKGRPKGSRNVSTVLAELLAKQSPDDIVDLEFIKSFITRKRVTNADAMAARLLYDAIVKGSVKAITQINKMLGDYAPVKIAETDIDGNDKPSHVILYLPDNSRDK